MTRQSPSARTEPEGEAHPDTVRHRLSEAVIDLSAIAHNTRILAARSRGAALMAVVKADGFGHGAVQVARTALAHGATWLGAASTPETLELREAGITAPILAWMRLPREDVTGVIRQDVDLSAASLAHLAGIAACAEKAGIPGAVHLEVDTGLGRNGAGTVDWPRLLEAAAEFERRGLLRVRGVWSHLVHPDDPRHAGVAGQVDAFETAVSQARAAGLRPEVLHLANSAAALAAPDTHYDLVRAGLGLYGVEPVRGESFGLRPAMTLRGRVIVSRRVEAGTGVSYGHEYVAERPTSLALVPLGFADGLPFRASRSAEILVGGARRRVAGRIAMDQCVVNTGDDQIAVGEDAVVFGPGDKGEPTAAEWADWAGTVPHEILTGVGPRVPRRYLHADAPAVAPKDTRTRVVVLFGGPGGEHEVSCASAAGIVGHLDRSRYAVQPVRITRAREWVPGPSDFPEGACTAAGLTDVTPSRGMGAGDSLRAVLPHLACADAVVPALHGPFGEDGTVQGLLEAANVTYVGNGVSASTIAMDKDATKRILSSVGLPVADWTLLRGGDSTLSGAERLRLGLPAFVKPARAGSSIGVTRVESWEDLGAALGSARSWDTKVLVEEAIQGREIDIAVLEHPDGRLEAGPPLEIAVHDGRPFFDYEAKYRDTATSYTIPAQLDEDIAKQLQRMAVDVFEALNCSGLIRVDFFLRDGVRPVVNEVNTFPGFTAASQFPRIWAAAGLSYERLLDTLITTAVTRTGSPAAGLAAR